MDNNNRVREYRQFYDQDSDTTYTRWSHEVIALTGTGHAVSNQSKMTGRSIYTPPRDTAMIADVLKLQGVDVQLHAPDKEKNSRISRLSTYQPKFLCAELELGSVYRKLNPETNKPEGPQLILGGFIARSKKGDGRLFFFNADKLLAEYEKHGRINDITVLQRNKGMSIESIKLFDEMIPVKVMNRSDAYLSDFLGKNGQRHNFFRINEQIQENRLDNSFVMLNYAADLYQKDKAMDKQQIDPPQENRQQRQSQKHSPSMG